MAIKNTKIHGDVSVGRDVAMGGKATVAGDVTVGHNLRVKGWIEARNIKDTNKGLFERVEDLEAKYPTPLDGWWAGVKTERGTSPDEETVFLVYLAKNGSWQSTPAVLSVTLDTSAYDEQAEAISETLAALVGVADEIASLRDGQVVSVTSGQAVGNSVQITLTLADDTTLTTVLPVVSDEKSGIMGIDIYKSIKSRLVYLENAVSSLSSTIDIEHFVFGLTFGQSAGYCHLKYKKGTDSSSTFSLPLPIASRDKCGVLKAADFAAFAGKLDVVVGEFDAAKTPSAYGGDDSRPCLFVSDTDSTVAIWDSDKGHWVPMLGCLGHWDVTDLVNRARTDAVNGDEVEALGAAITSGKLVTYNTKPCIAWTGVGGDVFLLTADGALVTLRGEDGRANYEARWLERVTALETRVTALETRVDSLFAEDPIDEPVDDSSQTEMPAPTNS